MNQLFHTLVISLIIVTCVFSSELNDSIFFKSATTLSSDSNTPNSIFGRSIGKDGSLYEVISFQTSSLKLGNNTHKNVGGASSCLVVKFSSKLEPIWVQSFAIDSKQVTCLNTQFDSSDNIYVTLGLFEGSLQVINKTYTKTSTSKFDMVFVKISSDGSIVWSTRHENDKNVELQHVTLCSDNSIFYAAIVDSMVVKLNSQQIYSASEFTWYLSAQRYTMFVKLKPDGTFHWARGMEVAILSLIKTSVTSDFIYICGSIPDSTKFQMDNLGFDLPTCNIILFKFKLTDGSNEFLRLIMGDKKETIRNLHVFENGFWMLGDFTSSKLEVDGTNVASVKGNSDVFYVLYVIYI
jgi:hypothetical protein